MKILKQLNNFAEKHWCYHKEIGNGKAIFYYRSIWNVIFRRKCNQYVVNVGDAKLVEWMMFIGSQIETWIIHPFLRMHYFEPTFWERCLIGFFLTSIIYHICTYLNITCNYTNINL